MKEKLSSAAKIYNQLPVPQDYEDKINRMIQEAESTPTKTHMSWAKKSSIAAALVFGVFVSTLNVNAQFASTMAQIPIIGEVAQLFTFTQKEEKTDVYELEANIPNIHDEQSTDYTEKVNEAINVKMQTLIADAKVRAQEFKDAYVATGGKEENFSPIQIDIDYDVKYSKDGIVSFIINHIETSASAYNEQYFYNLDLVSNKEITLQDLFGTDYTEAINQEIIAQMQQRVEENDAVYFEEFKGINETQDFYINPYGEVVIVFDKYEIAPGAMGRQEFVIKDVDMQVQYPSQVSYSVEKKYLEDNKDVSYPEIVGFKGELLMDYMNQSLYSVIEKYSKPSYSNLNLDYEITRIDDTVLSVTFLGHVDLEGIGTVPIKESINLDTAKTGQELTINNYIKPDAASRETWQQLLNEKAQEKGLAAFEAEGIRMCFKDERVVFYYMPLDDSAAQFVYITLTLEELAPITVQEFEHIYHS